MILQVIMYHRRIWGDSGDCRTSMDRAACIVVLGGVGCHAKAHAEEPEKVDIFFGKVFVITEYGRMRPQVKYV